MAMVSHLNTQIPTNDRESLLYQLFLETFLKTRIYPTAYRLKKWAEEYGYKLGGGHADRLRKRFIQKISSEYPMIPESDFAIWDDYPQIEPPVLVISDLHIPYHDSDWLDRILIEAKRRDILNLLIAGDLIDSKRVSRWGTEDGLKLDEELDFAKTVIEEIKKHFTVQIILGNHDERLSNLVGREIRTEQLLSRWLDVEVHRYHQAYVGSTWLISHPQNYSRMPAQPALALATKYEMNVAVAHTHQFSIARTLSGKWWAVEIGTCMNPELVEYLHRNLSTHPKHQKGALIIERDERPVFLHPDIHF